MRVTALTTTIHEPRNESLSHVALSAWQAKTAEVRVPGWTWTDLDPELILEGIQALLDDGADAPRSMALAVAAVLDEASASSTEPAGQWAWSLPLGVHGTLSFQAKLGVDDDLTTDEPAFTGPQIELTADTAGDRAQLALMGALNQTRQVQAEALAHVLDTRAPTPEPERAPWSLGDLDRAAVVAELMRIDGQWPKLPSFAQLFLLATPIAVALRGQAMHASTTEIRLRGLTLKGERQVPERGFWMRVDHQPSH